MDRLIWISWRAFWVGLGASLVLIVQSLAAHPSSEAPADPTPAYVVPQLPAPVPAAKAKTKSDPALSRNAPSHKRGPFG